MTLFWVIAFTPITVGQGAQATMRVSVEVVSGSSVEVEQPDVVSLVQGRKLSLGMLKMKGDNNVLVNSTSTLTLKNEDGEEVEINVLSQKEQNASGQQRISFKGISRHQMMSSVYRGSLTTTIEYL